MYELGEEINIEGKYPCVVIFDALMLNGENIS